jgi:hypothetical protein
LSLASGESSGTIRAGMKPRVQGEQHAIPTAMLKSNGLWPCAPRIKASIEAFKFVVRFVAVRPSVSGLRKRRRSCAATTFSEAHRTDMQLPSAIRTEKQYCFWVLLLGCAARATGFSTGLPPCSVLFRGACSPASRQPSSLSGSLATARSLSSSSSQSPPDAERSLLELVTSTKGRGQSATQTQLDAIQQAIAELETIGGQEDPGRNSEKSRPDLILYVN